MKRHKLWKTREDGMCRSSSARNMFVSYADDAILLACIPSPNMRSDVTEYLNRDLTTISTQ